METREDYLLKLASVLNEIGSDQHVTIRGRYIGRAFGGTGAISLCLPLGRA